MTDEKKAESEETEEAGRPRRARRTRKPRPEGSTRRGRVAFKNLRKGRAVAVLLVFTLLVALLAAAVIDTWDSGTIFRGVTIDGIPVQGMTRKQALKVSEDIAGQLGQPLVLYWKDESYPLGMNTIDFKVDAEKMTDLAYWKGQEDFILIRLFKRLFGLPKGGNVPVVYSYDAKKLKDFVANVAKQTDYPPTSASIDVSSGAPEIIAAKNGLTVKQDATVNAILETLPTKNRRLQLVVEEPKPELTEADIGKIVVISLSQHTLYLYDKESPVSDYLVGVGMPQYPTPKGRFHITYKEKNPTWLPTSEWAKDKQGIPQPPGPNNPLGGYWMDLGGGIGIHATPYEKTLGQDASHGCIRMADWAAADLFNQVKVGTPVFIIQ